MKSDKDLAVFIKEIMAKKTRISHNFLITYINLNIKNSDYFDNDNFTQDEWERDLYINQNKYYYLIKGKYTIVFTYIKK